MGNHDVMIGSLLLRFFLYITALPLRLITLEQASEPTPSRSILHKP
jgi:hypothetical protein